MQKNQRQVLYEETLTAVEKQIREARSLNRDAHADWLKEVHRLIDREMADLADPDNYYPPETGL